MLNVPLAEHHLCADDAKDCLEAWLGSETLAWVWVSTGVAFSPQSLVTCDYDTFFTPLHVDVLQISQSSSQ